MEPVDATRNQASSVHIRRPFFALVRPLGVARGRPTFHFNGLRFFRQIPIAFLGGRGGGARWCAAVTGLLVERWYVFML